MHRKGRHLRSQGGQGGRVKGWRRVVCVVAPAAALRWDRRLQRSVRRLLTVSDGHNRNGLLAPLCSGRGAGLHKVAVSIHEERQRQSAEREIAVPVLQSEAPR